MADPARVLVAHCSVQYPPC
jgi:translation initiation factor IF-1